MIDIDVETARAVIDALRNDPGGFLDVLTLDARATDAAERFRGDLAGDADDAADGVAFDVALRLGAREQVHA